MQANMIKAGLIGLVIGFMIGGPIMWTIGAICGLVIGACVK